MTKTFDATEIVRRLRSRHGGGRGDASAFLTEVADGTGHRARRFCDALAMDLWPSSGMHLYGYEVKVSRGDWVREMQDCDKADAFAKYCDYWFVAAAPGVVELAELPASWGLLEPVGVGMKIRKPAERRTPQPISKHFLAALLRYSVRQSPAEKTLATAIKEAREDAEAVFKKSYSYDLDRTTKQLAELQERVAAFEKASGVSISRWGCGGEAAGKAFRFVADGGLAGQLSHLKHTAERLQTAAKTIADVVAEVEGGEVKA